MVLAEGPKTGKCGELVILGSTEETQELQLNVETKQTGLYSPSKCALGTTAVVLGSTSWAGG